MTGRKNIGRRRARTRQREDDGHYVEVPSPDELAAWVNAAMRTNASPDVKNVMAGMSVLLYRAMRGEAKPGDMTWFTYEEMASAVARADSSDLDDLQRLLVDQIG